MGFAESKSETEFTSSTKSIVVPCVKDDQLMFVLDIDDLKYGAFNEIDKIFLEIIVKKLIEKGII
jgi:putative methionine-R-sulfoxide reductase with GAF domain